MKKQKWGAIAKKTMVFLTSCTLMVGGLSYAPAVFYSDPAAITAEALTCNAPSPIAWQQDSTSRAQIDSYLTGISYWNNHLWTSIGSRNQTIGSSACGLFSVINSVFYKTGNFMDPTFVADWSKANGYRTANNGVDTRFFKAYAQNYGSTYGFSYAGSYSSVSSALEHVRNGGTICGCVPGHWIAIVDYNASTGKYLMLDSSRASSRCSSIGGWSGERGVAWVSGSIFSSGKYTLSGRCMYGLSYSGNRPTPVPDTNTASDSQLPWNYTYPTRTLYQKSPMMNGNDVRWLQSALSYLGYACTVDGYLGAETKNQIRAYQSANGLSVDGKAGTKTLSSLKAKAEAKNNGSSDGQ
ncbi:MAG: peptidoglycan-binding domain-containing protein, partial [Ruminococcus sp.]|nr:peptidoglycan-binding domain-containing protein [Ruminococcus sp.]